MGQTPWGLRLGCGLDKPLAMQHSSVLAALVQSVGHALASPLALIRGRAELLARAGSDPARVETAGRIVDQVDQVVALLERIRTFAAALEPAGRTPVRDQIDAARAARRVSLEIEPGARELAGDLPAGCVEAVLSGLEAYALAHGGRLRLDRGELNAAACLELELALPSGATLPASQTKLRDPWLEAPTPDATARFELALALGVLNRCGGCHQQRLGPPPALLLFLPIQG